MEDCISLKTGCDSEETASFLIDVYPFFKNILACFPKMKL
jgi:hypothetical protein